MKRRFICGIICSAIFFAACHSSESAREPHVQKFDSFAIIGKITGQDSGTVYIQHRESASEKTDSAQLDHGYFTFKGVADGAEYCLLGIAENGEPRYRKGFFLENGKISMLIKKDSLADALISGTPVQDEFNNYESMVKGKIGARSADLDKKYKDAALKKDKSAMDSLDKEYDVLDNEQKKIATDYAKAHPGSHISAFEIYRNFSYNPDADQLGNLYGMLDTAVQSGYFGKKINDLVKKAKLTAIGQAAPDFTATDTEGKPVSLSSFKGRYLLVDFWASWCGPCRRENPSVVQAYRQYHNKGFDILGVSLDNTRADWLEAIKKDGLDWTQVSDLKGWQNDVASEYGIRGIPMNFLLDKEGRIVAKGLRGEELTKKLQEVLP
jgi:peroxiredoxin